MDKMNVESLQKPALKSSLLARIWYDNIQS